jgi:hypothetical protein
MENKQTAVEWFLDQLIEHRIIIVNKTTYQVKYKHEILLEQAKAMHKEEIKDAIFWGNIKGYDEHKRTCIDDEDEQYYNETFNPKEK